MSHTANYFSSYTAQFQALMELVLLPQTVAPYTGLKKPHITSPFCRLGNEDPSDAGKLHGGIDFNYEGGVAEPLNAIGASSVYSPIGGSGNDRLEGNAGNDTLDGGADDDIPEEMMKANYTRQGRMMQKRHCFSTFSFFPFFRGPISSKYSLAEILLSLAFVTVLFLPLSANAQDERFLLRTDCRDGTTDYCAVGRMQPNTRVTLLHSSESKTCETVSIGTFIFTNEASGKEIPTTRISAAGCEKFPFAVVVRGDDVSEYKYGGLEQVHDSDVIRRIDSDVRRKRQLVEVAGGEHRTALADKLPRLLRMLGMKQETYIAVFDNKLLPGDETHVFYSHGNVKRIHGAAKLSAAFSINGQSFLHYKFACSLGCGWRGDFIVSIGDADFQIVLFDDSWST